MKFAEALEKEGVAFIGPTSKAIFAMGDKIESKKLAKAAGVNMIPGRLSEIENPEDVIAVGMLTVIFPPSINYVSLIMNTIVQYLL